MMKTFRLMYLLIAVSMLLFAGCDDKDNPFQRRPITPEQNTVEWRYFHNYSMFDHEHSVLINGLSRSRVSVRGSWSRLREYLIGMRENMPAESSFAFLALFDEYDTAMNGYLNDRKPSGPTENKLESLKLRIDRDYSPKDIYPDYNP